MRSMSIAELLANRMASIAFPVSMAGGLQHCGLPLQLHSLSSSHNSTPCSRQRVCIAGILSPLCGSSTRGVPPRLGAPHSSDGRPQTEGLWVQRRAPAAARATSGGNAPLSNTTSEPASTGRLPWGSGLTLEGSTRRLIMRFPVNGIRVVCGACVLGDFPDSPGDGWATALAYRQHVERVVARLREDPDAEVQAAAVDGEGRRLRAWAPGDESVRPSVLAAIRGALGLGLGLSKGRRRINNDLPVGTGFTRTPAKRLTLAMTVEDRHLNVGTAAGGDFPDSPDDGWATALAYRQHVERVVARLREDPDAEVQAAAVDGEGRRLRAWAPGDESVRPSVLAAIRGALARTAGSVACGDFPDSPSDRWATALAYRQHVERVVARLREDPDAEVQAAAVDGEGRRLRAWAPGDQSVRPSVLAAIRGALGLEPHSTPGRRRTSPDLPEGSGLTRRPGVVMCKTIQGRAVLVGTAAGGDFPDSPGDGWATALAYRQHVERVVARLREDPDAEVEVAETGKYGRRLRAWAPGDESMRSSVLEAIRRALRD